MEFITGTDAQELDKSAKTATSNQCYLPFDVQYRGSAQTQKNAAAHTDQNHRYFHITDIP